MPDTDLSTYLTDLTRTHHMPRARYVNSALSGNAWSYRISDERVGNVDDKPRWRLRARADADTPAGTAAFTIGDATLRWSAEATTRDLEITVLRPRGGSVVVAVGGELDFTFPSIGLFPVGVAGQPPPANDTGGNAPEHTMRRNLRRLQPVGRAAPSNAAANPLTTSLPLGRSRLIIDETLQTARLLPALDVAGTVFRLGSSGLMAMFDTMSWTQVDGADEVRMHGGRLVRNVRNVVAAGSSTGTDG